ncbi:hypothetical protein D3C73_1471510 [compost metagenome]
MGLEAELAGAVRAIVGDGVYTCASGSFGRMLRSAATRMTRPTMTTMTIPTSSTSSMVLSLGRQPPAAQALPIRHRVPWRV